MSHGNGISFLSWLLNLMLLLGEGSLLVANTCCSCKWRWVSLSLKILSNMFYHLYRSSKVRAKFDLYISTTAEREYATEAWRLLDPQQELIAREMLKTRLCCVKKELKSLKGVFSKTMYNEIGNVEGPWEQPFAIIADDRLDVRHPDTISYDKVIITNAAHQILMDYKLIRLTHLLSLCWRQDSSISLLRHTCYHCLLCGHFWTKSVLHVLSLKLAACSCPMAHHMAESLLTIVQTCRYGRRPFTSRLSRWSHLHLIQDFWNWRKSTSKRDQWRAFLGCICKLWQ